MIKALLAIYTTLLACKTLPQKHLEPVHLQSPRSGYISYETLTQQEAIILDTLLQNVRDTFNFYGKKIAFTTNSSGSRIISKAEFFDTCINPWIEKGDRPQIFMQLLTGEEKSEAGGYDALVLSWVKVFTAKQKRNIIEQLAPK